MAIYADRVREITTTTGTGSYSLGGAVQGFRGFVAAVGTGSVITYVAENGTDWEIGEGTVTDLATDTLSRTTIIGSSNAGAAVSWGAGNKNIFLTLSAARTVTTDKSNTFTANVAATSASTGTLVVTGGVGVSGNLHVAGSVVGNASTATALQTARSINGTSFNGSANITTTNWGTARTLTLGSTGKSVNGSANVSWTLAEMGAAPTFNPTFTGIVTAPIFLGELTGNVAGNAGNVTGIVALANGGTGATTAATARTSLGLGSMATQASSAVDITGGSLLAVTLTAPTVAGGEMAGTTISGGTVDGAAVGATTRGTGAFTTLTSNGATTLTANTASTSTTTGTLVVTGGVGVDGDLHVGGQMVGIATSAQYADLAENYRADAAYEPGTVVEFGGAEEVTQCDQDNSRRIAGVVSTRPAYLMNSQCTGTYVSTVAFTGRVPCKVVGPVRKGDMMVSAGAGRARADADPATGAVIGKALQDFEGDIGVIEVVVGR